MADSQTQVTCYLGGVPFRTGPEEIRWEFSMMTSEQKCLGGKVIQILGVDLGDLTVQGKYGSGKKGEEGDWEEQWRVRDRVKKWARGNESVLGTKPLRFLYPPRNWDFNVFIKKISGMAFEVPQFGHPWEFVLTPDFDGAREVSKDIKDIYIKRLMDGVGWKQTDYNGPTAEEVSALLAGMTVGEYLASKAQEAFDAGLPGGQIGRPAL